MHACKRLLFRENDRLCIYYSTYLGQLVQLFLFKFQVRYVDKGCKHLKQICYMKSYITCTCITCLNWEATRKYAFKHM